MSTKRILFFAGIIVCLVVADWGYHLYNQPRQGVGHEKPVSTLTAADLYQAYSGNEQEADKRFLGKVIAVSGTVQAVQAAPPNVQVLLQTGAAGAINCSMPQDEAKEVKEGMQLQVKGKCTGFLMDVNLVDAVVSK